MPDSSWTTVTSALRTARGGLHAYRDFKRRAETSREQTETLLRRLQLGLEGVSVLELGPGAGAALDVLASHGAVVRFIERNPLLALECVRHGHRGWRFDFVRSRDRIPRDFRLIYARGSIGPRSFADGRDFGDWLARLGSSNLILCPWMQDPTPEWFIDELEAAGCHRTEWIEGYSVPVIYPDVWIRGVEASPAQS